MIDAARMAPSAANKQAWHLIVIRDEAVKNALADAYPRDWFLKAPVIIVACGEPELSWARIDGKNFNDIDVAIAVDHITLAAAEEGLGTCWIGAFDQKLASKALKLPENIIPVVMTPLGYPADATPKQKERKILSQIVHWEKW